MPALARPAADLLHEERENEDKSVGASLPALHLGLSPVRTDTRKFLRRSPKNASGLETGLLQGLLLASRFCFVFCFFPEDREARKSRRFHPLRVLLPHL